MGLPLPSSKWRPDEDQREAGDGFPNSGNPALCRLPLLLPELWERVQAAALGGSSIATDQT